MSRQMTDIMCGLCLWSDEYDYGDHSRYLSGGESSGPARQHLFQYALFIRGNAAGQHYRDPREAFKNCRSLERVTLPEHLTYLGGEAFYHCSSLEEVNLPAGLTEIRGNTFEECSSLLRIEIPDNVTRIGGHAFYGNTSLEEVVISPDSKLQQIGSSAFRCCDSLREITLPRGVSVNERAFKETPVRIDYYEY